MSAHTLVWRWAPIALAAAALVGCAPTHRPPRMVEAIQATAEPVEATLLDVAIQVFDPGLPPGTKEELEEQAIYPDVRRSEARFIPFHLKETLQATGHWGVVRVAPRGSEPLDLLVTGRIEESNGKRMKLAIRASDARGQEWLQKDYEALADTRAYSDEGIPIDDPYQTLYNQIANDLLTALNRVGQAELQEIRDVAAMRFAADLAPEPFGAYIAGGEREGWRLTRLPAENDPMVERLRLIRERDHMLVDTLNEYYGGFYAQMSESYDDWRAYSFEEQQALDELRHQARMRGILGGLAILGAILAPDSVPDQAKDLALLGGIAAIRSGINTWGEAKIHKAALQELADSFEAELQPLVVDVEDRTLRLTGSAEEQYAQWRVLLRQLLDAETGLPRDPNTDQPLTLPVQGSR